jgi:hypothetical protein
MTRARMAALVAVSVLPLALAACGDDNGTSSADQDQITAAINKAAVSGDPSACTEVETQKFVEQTGDGKGQAAVKSCEKDASDSVADKVDVTDVEVDGNNATANAAVTGSIFDGQTLQIALVKDGDQWKLDEFKGFEDFDRDSLNASFEKEITSDPDTPQQGADCIKKQVESASDEDLEALFVGNDPSAEDKIFKPCEQFFQGQ